ncbi:MAG TPA: hypothetical protein VFT32_07650 [Candidatus Eisenbacteria bacterium]|nr:hypothetical protein [Candidatus Eisenbacteria bacterium]
MQFSDGSTWGMSSSMMGGYRTHYWEQRSNKNGVASFEHIPASMTKGVLRAKSSSHPKVSRNLELAPLLTEIEITLEAGGSLTAHVVDPEGKSVACKIVLTGPGIEGYDPLNQKEKAAGEKAVYEGVPAGPALSLTIYRFEGLVHIESGIVAMPSQTRDVLIRLPAQCKATFMARDRLGNPVSGSLELTRVRGALGVPVSGLPQDYLHYSRRIDESGKTELSVFVGLYKVRFQPHDGARVEKEVRIESDTTVDLDVTSQAALSGVVIDSGGAPVSGVVIYWIEGSEYWVAKSGLDGRFKFSRVIGRDGKLYAGHGGVTVEAYSGPAPLGDLRILFPMSTLRGRVTRTNGEPAPALVTISPVKFGSIAGDALSPVATKSDGTFEARVPSGLWKIFAFSEDASPNPRPMQVDLSAPGNVVDITYELQAAPKSP